MTERPRIRVRQTRIIDRPGSPVHGLRVRVADIEVPVVLFSGTSETVPQTEDPLVEGLNEINRRLSRRRTPKIVQPPPLKR